MSRGKKTEIKFLSGQLHLPYFQSRDLFISTEGETGKLDTREISQGGQDGYKKNVTFFLGQSSLSGKLVYCEIPINDNADLLTRLSKLRQDDQEALELIPQMVNARVWILQRYMVSGMANAWSGAFSPTDDVVLSYIQREESSSGVTLVDDCVAFFVPIPRPNEGD